MSFLSRKPARPGGRDGGAGRGDEHDDYDLYAPDGYQGGEDEEGWSPNQYFSPEGIKGRWAGEHPEGRSGGRGPRDDGQDPASARGNGFGADEYASGAYDIPDGAVPGGPDEDRPERPRRKRRDERNERTGILWLRRDKGEDIWPDDGISDEDYWASVASDQPLAQTSQPASRERGKGQARPAADAGPGAGGAGSRFGSEQRDSEQPGGEPRGVTGRLGPPPGLGGEHAAGSGYGTDWNSSGARPATGPTPTVGVTASRPPAGPNPGHPGPTGARSTGPRPAWPPADQRGQAQPGTSPAPGARATFQPSGQRSADPLAGARPSDRGDWGDRTERIERIPAAGYPDPRNSASAAGLARVPPAGPGPSDTSRGDSARGDSARHDGGSIWSTPAPGGADGHRASDDPLTSTAFSRSVGVDTDGRSYRVAARRSQAQAQLTDQTEVFPAAQHRQAQYPGGRTGEYPTASFQPAASFQPTQPQASGTSEYRQHRGDNGASASGSRYPAYGTQPEFTSPGRSQAGPGQPSGGQPTMSQPAVGRPAPGQPGMGQPGYGAQGPRQGGPSQTGAAPSRGQHARRPDSGAPPARPAQPGVNGFPGGGQPGNGQPGGAPTGSYEAQSRASHRHQQSPVPQPGQSRAPSGPLSAPIPADAQPYPGTRAASSGSQPSASGPLSAGGTSRRPENPSPSARTVPGGPNPYDTGASPSYPYAAGQSYAGRPSPAAPGPDSADDPYYRSGAPSGYPGGGDQRRPEPGDPAYRNNPRPQGERPY